MSDILADGKTTGTAPNDGLAVLESQRSTAETFGIPLAVLAELTHRARCNAPIAPTRSNSTAAAAS